MTHSHIVGCLLGTAIGDALGLPYEGLSPRRARRLFGPPDRHRLLPGRGMVSDDTEHACMVAQSLVASAGDLEVFARALSRRLRFWLLGVPAGTGWATLRSILRLWAGFGPDRSGVRSAGNGPAMRAAIIGAAIDDPERLRALVRISSRMTHTDPRAERGAIAVALAAHLVSRNNAVSGGEFLRALQDSLPGEEDELVPLLRNVVSSVEQGQSPAAFAETLGLAGGVSGYVYHSVPVALHAWLANPRDFRAAVTAVIRCGGDTDSTGAIVGGIVGAAVGKDGIPAEWLGGLAEWPRSAAWMERLAAQLQSSMQPGSKERPIELPAYGVVPRNLFFLSVVLLHGLRRLLPPY
jgi:ADP-ribosylglycohydrolase